VGVIANKTDRQLWLVNQRQWLLATLRRRLPPAAAEDAAQEALTRALATQSPPQTRRWLLTTARNAAVDAWRRERRSISLDAAAHELSSPPTLDRVQIAAAIGRLSSGDARLLRDLAAGYRYGEIAVALRLSEEAVRQRAARARTRLAIELDRTSGDEK
jgi:DNA-directed RNA polymerase specialized sigma24 family protein